MPHEKVRKAIDELHGELKQTPKETSALENTLEQAREGIERYTPEAVHELMDTLRRETDEFEAEHPRITALITQLTDALVGLGI